MVIRYSLLDNVITKQEPGVRRVGQLRGGPHRPGVRERGEEHRCVFTVASVVAHLVIGLAFALMLNSPLLGNVTKAFFRVLFILPWLFTVAIIAVLWRLLLDPNGWSTTC